VLHEVDPHHALRTNRRVALAARRVVRPITALNSANGVFVLIV
jgi:hypothetical protein